MLRLPLELCRYIIEEDVVSINDLCSASRACRAFQFEAERLLYELIQVESLADIVVWCKRIIACPRFGPHVYQFDFGSDAPSFQQDIHLTLFRQSFFSTLSRALKLMTRIRILRLPRLFGGKVSCGHLFGGCTFKIVNFYSHFPFDDFLVAFLEQQEEIDVFEDLSDIGSSKDIRALLHGILPNLSTLTTSGGDSCHLVPGRPITHLDIISTIPPSLWPSIALSLGPVRVLELVPSYDFACVMLDIPRLFPELEVLEGLDVILTEERSACLAVVSACRNLWGLSINIYWSDALDHECSLVQALHDSSPSLRVIDVCRDSNGYLVDEVEVRRWEWPAPDGKLVWCYWEREMGTFWDISLEDES